MNAPIRTKPDQIHHFDDGDESITVCVRELPGSQYIAVDAENPDVAGFGFSNIGAIADLFKKLPLAKSEREDRAADALAAKWDHDRALRSEAAE